MSAMPEEVYIGQCALHGWHGKTVCPRCREVGQVAVHVLSKPTVGKPRRYRLTYVNQSLLRFRGGGREKVRQEGRCRMCLRPRGPDTAVVWIKETQQGIEYKTGSRTLTRHHLIPQEWFRRQLAPTRAIRSVDANIVPLCRPCHDEVELDIEGRRMLRRVLGAEEVAFIVQLASENWFEARYPK